MQDIVPNVWDYRPCVWDYRESTWTQDRDLLGYDVEAADGSIGRIEKVANETFGAYVVVDTEGWIIGQKRFIPAGAITSIDHGEHKICVALTLEQVRVAPRFDADQWDEDTLGRHAAYFRPYTAT